MFEKINQEILKVKEDLRKRERLEMLIGSAEEHLEEENQRKKELSNVLHKEEMDVKRLEKLSVRGLFLTVLGHKEEVLDKEKQEFIAAKLRYDECCNSIRLAELELEGYNKQLKELSSSKDYYQELLKRKEMLITHTDIRYAKEILVLTEEIGDKKSDVIELKEAINAGYELLDYLRRAESELREAEDWGTWDMLGGGYLSTSAKHSHIDEAVAYVSEAKGSLNRFKRELSDVELDFEINIDIGSFDRFADYFFDGILADWSVQKKIENSLESVVYAVNKVSDAVGKLVGTCRVKEMKIEELKANINKIVEEAK